MFRDGTYAGAFYDEAYLTYFIAPGEATAHLAYNFGLRHFFAHPGVERQRMVSAGDGRLCRV